MVAICENAEHVVQLLVGHLFGKKKKTPTFESNRIVASELIWLELDLNLSYAYF